MNKFNQMDTEIELKYLVLGDNIPAVINDLLKQHNFTFETQTRQLQNCYFDTPNLDLRKTDIGLRVRKSSSGLTEQTIKTSGQVIGGLHQRPEYNINIESDFPNLSLFDSSIWPSQFAVEKINQKISPIFETNFSRITWLITTPDDNQIEMAFDHGQIISNDNQEGIKEIELELVKGDPETLLDFAVHLFSSLQLRPGTQSKAARGYGLAFGHVESHISSANTLLDITPEMDVLQTFNVGFQQCLAQLQQLIDQFMATPSLLLLKEISDTLALSRHGLWLYADYLTGKHGKILRGQIKEMLQELSWVETAKQIRDLTTKNGTYRKKIEYSKSLLTELKDENHAIVDFDKAMTLFHSEKFNLMQLSMTQMILMKSPYAENVPELSDFAPSWLSYNLKIVSKAFEKKSTLSVEEYLNNHCLVTRSLLTGSWFGLLFNGEGRMEFRGPWFDLHQGIDELETLQLLKNHLQNSKEDLPIKLINWLDNKVESLLCALEHCKGAALNLTPYWLK